MTPPGWVLEAFILFLGTVACLELGYRLGTRRSETSGLHEGIGGIESAVFGMLGLLIAFSFGAGLSRLDTRRQMTIQEANNIGTAYLRLDLLAAGDQPEMRRLFREYVDARLRVYQKYPDPKGTEQELARVAKMQEGIWSRAVTASRADATQNASRLLLPAINEMIDITTSRTVALYTHLPSLIVGLLIIVSLLSGLVAGYSMAKRQRRSWLHMVVYGLVVAITIYTVFDLDDPRSGLIRNEAADHAMVELKDSIR